MPRTLRRQPVTFSTDSSDYPRAYNFNQAQFKGISTEQNAATVDQQTFSDTKNVYIDENGLLVSRLPFKFYDDDAYILDRWDFGRYHLVLQRFICEENEDGTFTQVQTVGNHLHYIFRLSCSTTEILDKYTWAFPIASKGVDYSPKVNCYQIEDKIFVWFDEIDFLAFNTNSMKFEDASKYLYLPIHEVIANGIATEFESKNFLTDSYRRRHQLSLASQVDFQSLYDKTVEVYYKSNHLYNLTLQNDTENLLLHPQSRIGNYYTEYVETINTPVILHYDSYAKTILLSFGNGVLHRLPSPIGILREPLLTKDGLCVIAFTDQGLAKYEIPTDVDVENGSWTYESYPSNVYKDFVKIFCGCFDSADVYTYAFARNVSGNIVIALVISRSAGVSGYQKSIHNLSIPASGHEEIRVEHELSASRESIILLTLSSAYEDESKYRELSVHYYDKNSSTIVAKKSWTVENRLNTHLRDCALQFLEHQYESYATLCFVGNFTKDGVDKDFYMEFPANSTDATVVNVREREFSADRFLLSDRYRYLSDKYVSYVYQRELPDYREKVDVLRNGDRLTLARDVNTILSVNVQEVDNLPIYSGSLIHCATYANTKSEYQMSDYRVTRGYKDLFPESASINLISNVFCVKRLGVNSSGDDFEYIEGSSIRAGDFIVLEAAQWNSAPIDAPSNMYLYPETPTGWQVGDAWPESFPPYKPLYITNGIIREWSADYEDPLPTGPVKIYGIVNIGGDIRPLTYTDDKVVMIVDGNLWTSALSTDTVLELDETVKAYRVDKVTYVDVNKKVPTHVDLMNEYYLSYEQDNEYLLGVTEHRRDNDLTNLLLYLPKNNVQKFSSKITALHHLSDTEMGIFTENDIYYVSVMSVEGLIVYSKPIKSKIPTGLRDGDEVVTALDGQAVIFPSERGIVALAPQDFVATTEKTLTYLSDGIQSLYKNLYQDDIRINIYKYWILFHRKLGRDILAFDTRNASWWRWTTPYPIRSLLTNNGLRPLLQIDYPDTRPSLLGVPYVMRNDISYKDDVIANTLNGDSHTEYENEQIGERVIHHRADPRIDWDIVSQRLHFDQINNYKSIKSINLNLSENTRVRLSTKAFRDATGPEQDDVYEVEVDEIRTFVKRVNILRVMYFQYMLENDRDTEIQHQFKLNSLSLKYEVKERVR